jgi:tyrosine-specific transport protein
MERRIGAPLLIAGTCIGSGMIALPMVLAKIGIIPSILLMIVIWVAMYYSSLINLELNLQAGRGMSLGDLGRKFSGKGAEWIGIVSLKALSYSLLAAFLYGGSSIIQELIESWTGISYPFHWISSCYAICAVLILLLPLRLIDYLNRVLFIGLIGIVTILLAGLALSITWTDLPLFTEKPLDISAFAVVMPVLFTSFGFQVIFHTLTNYCHKDAKMLKSAFFFGSLLPAIVYILWTCSILGVIYHENPAFYAQMANGQAEVGELIQALSAIAKWPAIQALIWWISSLAIATSVIGVGIGLHESIKGMLPKELPANNLLASILTILPAYLVVVFVPNAFISFLGFAGMVLAIIAILLPVYLFSTNQWKTLYYPELKAKSPLWILSGIGVAIILFELYNMS